MAKRWDTTTQTQLGADLTGHTGSVGALAFDHAMRSLITIAGRPLTRTEWTRYVPSGIGYRAICP
ncbi:MULTISPECIES: hypothetical protein [Thermomonosporaceae]|uniref:hypothetical protein n=1 Tax=Thermomonosporaceae TaxID=2012 RepID=UPI00255AC009|nr:MULTISPECIES: hypothetical protein [Thermomonosporaceae]MDL4773428.1 hypothetical protein [Actinomadura xylanilytica]